MTDEVVTKVGTARAPAWWYRENNELEDRRHSKRHTGDTPTIIDAVNLWATGLGNNEDDQARWTEVHPPDWIEVLRHAGLLGRPRSWRIGLSAGALGVSWAAAGCVKSAG